jgi:CHASE3 domain sensor protein
MMTQTVQKRPEGNPVSDSSFLSEEKHRLNQIRICQEEIETLKEMKEEEKEEVISQGRKKWFNKQIDDLRKKINQVKGDNSE